MISTYFANKKSLQVTSQQIKNDIKSEICKIGSFNLNSKYYTFLNKKNVNNLKESDFLVSLSTFGKKFILFITKYNTKKYCIFINKKNDTMTVTQLKFSDSIFDGTLFDGELVKNSNNKWIFLINDIAYYKGTNIITSSFKYRCSVIKNILENEYDNNDDIENQTFFISQKQYFDYKYIKDMVDFYINELNYKCAGLYFKSINNFSDNYLFIFPECRSDSKILNNYSEEMAEQMPVKKIQASSISKSVLTEPEENKKNISSVPSHIPIPSTSVKLEKTTCRFLIHPTHLPDIYELYCSNNNNSIEKYNYAGVPDMDASNFIKNLFTSNYNNHEDLNQKIEKNNAIYVECNYHKIFKKWVPYKKVDNMDSVNTINSVQIILDSL